MKRKEYSGLEAEVILFGDKDINTVELWHYSGCYLGAVQFYTEDGNGNPMPLGVCWQENGEYSLDWEEYSGDIIEP